MLFIVQYHSKNTLACCTIFRRVGRRSMTMLLLGWLLSWWHIFEFSRHFFFNFTWRWINQSIRNNLRTTIQNADHRHCCRRFQYHLYFCIRQHHYCRQYSNSVFVNCWTWQANYFLSHHEPSHSHRKLLRLLYLRQRVGLLLCHHLLIKRKGKINCNWGVIKYVKSLFKKRRKQILYRQK